MAWESPLQRSSKSYSHKRRNVRFKGLRRVHTPPKPLTAHTAAYTAKQGRFGRGWYHYPRSVLRGSETLCGRVSERHTLPLFGLGRGLSKNTESLRDSDAFMRVAVPRRRGPAGLRDPVAIVSMIKNMINPWANTVKIRKSDSKKSSHVYFIKSRQGSF